MPQVGSQTGRVASVKLRADRKGSPTLRFCSALLQAGFNLAFWEKGVVGEGESDVVNDILTIALHNHIANVTSGNAMNSAFAKVCFSWLGTLVPFCP